MKENPPDWKKYTKWKSRFPHHSSRWHHKPPFPFVRRSQFLFLRFTIVFGLMAILLVGSMAGIAFLLSRIFTGGNELALPITITGCSLSLALPLLAAVIARVAFRGIATPLAGLLSASESIASGDLSVRVPEDDSGEFGRLVRAFNRMATELERMEMHRRQLTADIAHELRTPLHVIQGNLEGILDGVYEPTSEQISTLLEETHLLTRLVEDLQTLSLAESGELPLTFETVDCRELLADVQTSFNAAAENAGVRLITKISGEENQLKITADSSRLDQVLGNLIANALRYTMDGGIITLSLNTVQEGVQIYVEDNGKGIPADDLPHIFERFWRGERSHGHAGGAGSGLGLAIARQLVHTHQGTIEVESQPGKGTRFIITLPKTLRQA